MGAFTDMLLPDKGTGEEEEKVDQNDEGDALPGTARHREFYPEGVAEVLRVYSLQHDLNKYVEYIHRDYFILPFHCLHAKQTSPSFAIFGGDCLCRIFFLYC